MVYLDFSATSPLLPEVRDAVLQVMNLSVSGDLGNPSSLHSPGSLGRDLLQTARVAVSSLVDASPEELIFTSGGSESNNTVLHTFEGCPIFASAIEHHSVLTPATEYGRPFVEIPVDRQGIVNLTFLERELTRLLKKRPYEKILVSVMVANNETGVIEPLRELSALIKRLNKASSAHIFLHADATQAVGKIPVSVNALGVDYLTFSAHKLGGPIGIGALYVRSGSPFRPLIFGGAQESHRRAGTSNAVLAEGFRLAAQHALVSLKHYGRIRELRDYLCIEIQKRIKTAKIITPGLLEPSFEATKENPRIFRGDYERARSMAGATRSASRSARLIDEKNPTGFSLARKNGSNKLILPNVLSVSFPAAEGESIQLYLDLEGFAVSTGSACASGDITPSHVLMAMFGDAEVAHNSVRFSLGLDTKKSDLDKLLTVLPPIISRLQGLSTIKSNQEQP